MEYTPRQQLEIKGAFYYIVGLAVTFGLNGAVLQYFGNAGFRAQIENLIFTSFSMTLAITVYVRKKKGLKVTIIPWILGFSTTSLTYVVKYSHALTGGWTFALNSINTTGILIICVVMLAFFYQRKLLIFFSVFGIFNWVLFLILAYINGAELHFHSYKDGKVLVTGLGLWSEVSFILSATVIFIIMARKLAGIIKYDDQATEQYNQIMQQTESQNKIAEVIKEKTDSLFQKIESQHVLLNEFNLNMESQSARFSEMSATMEEISGASEQIVAESISQVKGNVKMDYIIDEFRDIRLETKRNLDETYNDIQSVSDQSATANEHLMEVEKTVYAIKDQSNRIGQTVELIVDIADRINLLSLNASIEAARAGESGKGFAVVADEIGKLAFQTQESIKEINNVITSSSKSTVEGATVIQKTARMMRDMISQMDQGANQIQTLQESLLIEDKFTQFIMNQMKDNIKQAEKISTATDEQKIAVESSFTTIEEVINILAGMLSEARDMARVSDEIYNNATDIITETEQIVSDVESSDYESSDYDSEN